MDAPTVYLVDDHTVVLKALEDMLKAEGFEVAGTATDEVTCLEGVRSHTPDVLVADLNLETRGNGLAMVRQIKDELPKTKIIVFSMRDQIFSVAAAFKAGVSGYIYKTENPFLVADAARSALADKLFFLPGQAEVLAAYYAQGDALETAIQSLGERDLEVFRLLARGLDLKEVAAQTASNEKTIANRAAEIARKLGCDRRDFTRVALLHGQIGESDLLPPASA